MQNHVYAIAEACKRAGLTDVIICPGSRSAPLLYAFATDTFFTCHSVIDERSAAYMALGMAQHNRKPAILISTSGTAAANFLPAVCEAFFQHVPLLVLTADRPEEMLHQQDGQMIDQKHLFGNHVKAFVQVPCYPHGRENLKQTFTLISEIIATSVNNEKGPVHINVPLAEPLYEMGKKPVFSQQWNAKPKSKPDLFNADLQNAWIRARRKLIVQGQHHPDAQLFTALHRLQDDEATVVFADLLSNQQHEHCITHFDAILTLSDSSKLKSLQPDLIISAGGPVLSKATKKWLQQCKPEHHFRIDEHNHVIDTYHNVTHHIRGKAADVLGTLTTISGQANTYKKTWLKLNELTRIALGNKLIAKGFSEFLATQELMQLIPDACNVQVGNSSIIRYVSWLANINPSWVISGNRGTSGIDGSTSTAAGAARVNNRLTFLLTGDVAFLYDIHILLTSSLPDNLKIVVFNNGGGRIFEWIDGPSRYPDFLPYFTTPHQADIQAICKAAKVHYSTASNQAQLKKAFSETLQHPGAAVLEIKFNPAENLKAMKQFKQIRLL